MPADDRPRLPDPPHPSPTDGNGGRTTGGRFAPGNRCAAGTHQSRVQQLKQAVIDCTDPHDVHRVMAKLLERALTGDVFAARIWLDRTCGRIVEIADPEPEDFAFQFRVFR